MIEERADAVLELSVFVRTAMLVDTYRRILGWDFGDTELNRLAVRRILPVQWDF